MTTDYQIIDSTVHSTGRMAQGHDAADETNQIERALRQFPYFDIWNRKTVSDCCRLSKVKVIPPDNIVLGPEENEMHEAHFIMEGTCKLIQHLLLVPKTGRGARKTYVAYKDKSLLGEGNAQDEPKYSSLLFNMERYFDSENAVDDNPEDTEVAAGVLPTNLSPRSRDSKEGVCEDEKPVEEPQEDVQEDEKTEVEGREDVQEDEKTEVENEEEEEVHEDEKPETEADVTIAESNHGDEIKEDLPAKDEQQNADTVPSVDDNTTEDKEQVKNEEVEEPEVRKESKCDKMGGKFSKFYRRVIPYMTAKKKIELRDLANVESHFIQIALIRKGCCLGLGENLENRFLVSVTEVTCLVIPQQFLLQHNPSNVWNRIKQFLTLYMPTEEEILSEFVVNRRWIADKKKALFPKDRQTPTKITEVPLSTRLNELPLPTSQLARRRRRSQCKKWVTP